MIAKYHGKLLDQTMVVLMEAMMAVLMVEQELMMVVQANVLTPIMVL